MCDSVVKILKDRVLFAKNSDRDANEAQALEWIPAAEHPKDSRLRCTFIDIPQAPRTHSVLLSRPFWIWGAEMGANEHGVVIGNEAVFTRERVPTSGLTGMDLVRLALERGETKERAVEQIIELIETHGQGGRCGHEKASFRYFSSFLVADAKGAIVLETSGRAYRTEEVTSGARSISNGLTIPGFAEQHSDTVKTWASACRARRARTEKLASSATSLADMMALLRDHGGEGEEPRYHWLHGGMGAPCMHAGGLVASSQTTASWVAELRPTGASHWVTATAAPCTSIFKPVKIEERLDLGPFPTDQADNRSLFWRNERLHRRVMQDPERSMPRFIEERDAIEARWLREPPEPEAAFREADLLLERWSRELGRGEIADTRPWYVRRYWQERNAWAGLV